MNVTLLGAGSMARGIATRLIAGGADVQILGPDAAKAANLADELDSPVGHASSGAIGDPITADIVILALPYPAVSETLGRYDGQLGDKIIVDITNPLNDSFDGLVTPADSSAAEEIEKLLPVGTTIVKAFNTTFAPTLVAGEVTGQPLDVFIAGNDPAAKSRLTTLVEAGGMRAIDAGALHRSHQLEAIALLHITLQQTRGTQFRTAVKIVG
jgi:NADPH-dependent F420 reductase